MGNRLNGAFLALTVALSGSAALADGLDAQEAYNMGDYATALKIWKPFAEQGVAEAQTHLGYLFLGGVGVPKDIKQAAYWFILAADQGDMLARINLLSIYDSGTDVPEGVEAAVRRWRGEPSYNLGLMYESGTNVTRDVVMAKEYFQSAAA